jgi:hypothetical protein
MVWFPRNQLIFSQLYMNATSSTSDEMITELFVQRSWEMKTSLKVERSHAASVRAILTASRRQSVRLMPTVLWWVRVPD